MRYLIFADAALSKMVTIGVTSISEDNFYLARRKAAKLFNQERFINNIVWVNKLKWDWSSFSHIKAGFSWQVYDYSNLLHLPESKLPTALVNEQVIPFNKDVENELLRMIKLPLDNKK